MLPKRKRVNKHDFDKAFLRGKFFGGNSLDLKVSENKEDNKVSFAFVVSKKEAKNATDRNFLKRRGKYAVLKNENNIKKGFVYIFLLKGKARKLSYHLFEEEMINLLNKAKAYLK